MARTKDESLNKFHATLGAFKPSEELGPLQRIQQVVTMVGAIEELYNDAYMAGYEDAASLD